VTFVKEKEVYSFLMKTLGTVVVGTVKECKALWQI